MAKAMVDGESVEIMHVSSATAINAVERAQVDMQIATAKAYPRDIGAAMKEARALALFDEETAEAMFYALPRSGKTIEGPSARLAEILAYSWGNLRAETDIESVDDTTLTAVGTCFDLEKNVAIRMRVKRRITDSKNKRYNEDMVVVTGNAASSIALRNAVFKVVPGAYWKPIYEDARRLAMGSAESIGKRWREALAFFSKLAVTEERVLEALGRESSAELIPEDFLRLAGFRTALREGDTTVEQLFPNPENATRERLSNLRDRMGGEGKKADDQSGKSAAKRKPPPQAEPTSADLDRQHASMRQAYDVALKSARPELVGTDIDVQFERKEWIRNVLGTGADEDKLTTEDLRTLIRALNAPRSRDPGEDDGDD